MATGNELLARIKDYVDEYSDSGAEQTRALRALNASRKTLQAEIWGMGEDYLLAQNTFDTVADTSPNQYTISTVNSNAFSDFGKIRYMEREVDLSAGDFERIWPIHNIGEKEFTYEDLHLGQMISSTTSTGEPEAYLVGDDYFQIFPISDDAYTIRVWYQKTITAIAASSTDITDIPEALQEVMVLDAAIEERIRRRDQIEDLLTLRERRLQQGLANLQGRVSDGPTLAPMVHDSSLYV